MAADLKETPFDPRLAALAHAGTATLRAERSGFASDGVIAEAVNAIACGLVYVGDQIARQTTLAAVLSGELEEPADLVTILNDALGRREGA